MLTFVLFPLVLFFLGAVLVTGLPLAQALQSYYANLGRRAAVCPESGDAVDVELDRKYALRTALRGLERSRVKSCSRWPEQGGCAQECLAQVDASPENIERLLSKWYEDKNCAICTRALRPSDWQQSRLGALDKRHRLIEMRQLSLENLQPGLQNLRPLCWGCHQDERARQSVTQRMYVGAVPN
jgi:hypothetical protein